jgi:hypothetical protein
MIPSPQRAAMQRPPTGQVQPFSTVHVAEQPSRPPCCRRRKSRCPSPDDRRTRPARCRFARGGAAPVRLDQAVALQPSPPLLFPSSQTSPSRTLIAPSPQVSGVHLPPLGGQTKAALDAVQSAADRRRAVTLPSSHCSSPRPRRLRRRCVETQGLPGLGSGSGSRSCTRRCSRRRESALPSSQASGCYVPSPQYRSVRTARRARGS